MARPTSADAVTGRLSALTGRLPTWSSGRPTWSSRSSRSYVAAWLPPCRDGPCLGERWRRPRLPDSDPAGGPGLHRVLRHRLPVVRDERRLPPGGRWARPSCVPPARFRSSGTSQHRNSRDGSIPAPQRPSPAGRVLKQAAQLLFSHAFVKGTVLWPAVRASDPNGEELTTAAVVFTAVQGRARRATPAAHLRQGSALIPDLQFGGATDPNQPRPGHHPVPASG